VQQNAERLISTALPAGEAFLDTLAIALFACCAEAVDSGDLSSVRVLAPSLPVASELRSAILRAAPRPLLLPRFDTLARWVGSASFSAIPEPMPDSERIVLLREALRERGWFDEAALWGIASEMTRLFDELTTAALTLPDDQAGLLRQLQRAYAQHVSAPLAFEARVVHELWRAQASAGRPDTTAVYRMRLAALAKQVALANASSHPLLVLLKAAPEESLDPAEHDFLLRYGQVQPLFVFHPAPRSACASPLMATLAAAWPEESHESALRGSSSVTPLFDRAIELATKCTESPLIGRLQLVPATGREQEAAFAVAQIGAWLEAGKRRIVLISQDRLTARRVRALLERENVLVSDETGWKLSTSRAAAAVDALIETVAGGAYHRDLLDLCKSPFVFSDCDVGMRKAAIFTLETAIRTASVKSGLSRFRRCLIENNDAHAAAKELGLGLLDRVEAAATLLLARPAPLVRWIARLLKALQALGALEPLRQDAAGKVLIDLLELRRQELEDSAALFSFAVWRDWLNREFESTNFCDDSISSPIVLTPLNAIRMRGFEAALLLGGDARQLAPTADGLFFNQSVRRELGLRTRDDVERDLRRDLEMLLATVPQVTVTWQSEQDGEANLLAPDLALLSTLHRLAWQDDLLRPPLPVRGDPAVDQATAPRNSGMAAPVVPPELIPHRVSVSAYASLVACPYLFFARHVLKLGEMDEVSEAMAKRDYGALVHRVLERFHERHPVLAELAEDQALVAMQDCVAEVFAPAVDDDFLVTGWRLRWGKRLAAYLDWQRDQEAQGWHWSQAETRVSRILALDDAGCTDGRIELYGRIDRIDLGNPGATNTDRAFLLDYKTQAAKTIRDRLQDDIQLPTYVLLHGHAVRAAYVALDDERVLAVAAGDEEAALMAAAGAQGQRLQTVVASIYAGARLPAQGVDNVCQWCEMRGLCRRDHVQASRAAIPE